MGSWRKIVRRSAELVMNKLLHLLRSIEALILILPGVSPAWFTTYVKIKHSEDEAVRSRTGSYAPPNPFRGLEDSVGLVVPGENADSETRRLLLPTLQSGYYSYNNDINAHNISVPHGYYCCGTKFNWLILIDDSLDIHLYNPLSDSKIQLPSLTTADPDDWRIERFGKCFVDKTFLSCEPVPESLSQTFLLILYGGNLAFCKLGDEAWTVLERYDGEECGPGNMFHDYNDAVYYKDKFYVICDPGYLVIVDINANIDHPIVTFYDVLPGEPYSGKKRYLVESKGELFQVKRYVKYDDDNDSDVRKSLFGLKDASDGQDKDKCIEDDENNNDTKQDKNNSDDGGGIDEHGENNTDGGGQGEDVGDSLNPECPRCGSRMVPIEDLDWEWSRHYRTTTFEIFKLREGNGGEQEWEKVESIGDRSFFVGWSSSFSLSALDVPGYKPNSIYFTDHLNSEIGWPEAIRHDIGVFSLEDKTVEDIYPIDCKPVKPYPFWFAPFHGRN